MSASSRPSRFRCWKCWSMITPGRTPSPAAIWAMRCLGVAPLRPERDHVAAHRGGPGAGAGDDGAVRGSARGSASARRVPPIVDDEAQLVAAGQEDARRVADGERRGLVVGLRPGHRVERLDRRGAELA